MPKASVNGISLYYEVHGQGEPLVMIQGYGGKHDSWFFQTRAFQKHYRVIVFDNRGMGKSDGAGEAYTVRTMAADVAGLMDHLGIGKAHVLGVSLGGMVAQEIAISYPERVMKLVLCSTSTGDDDMDNIHPDMMKAIGITERPAEVDMGSFDFRKSTNAIIGLSFNKKLYRMLLLPLSKVAMRFEDFEPYVKQMGAVMGYGTGERLHLIKVPTLVITGTGDRIIAPRASEKIASLIPNASLVKIEGGSHAMLIEERGRFNKEVLGFLSGG